MNKTISRQDVGSVIDNIIRRVNEERVAKHDIVDMLLDARNNIVGVPVCVGDKNEDGENDC